MLSEIEASLFHPVACEEVHKGLVGVMNKIDFLHSFAQLRAGIVGRG